MKKFFTVFMLIPFFMMTSLLADEKSDNIEKKKAQDAIVIINHINWVVSKIVNYNNVIVLEQEYEALSPDSLYLSVIEDSETIDLIKQIYNAITNLRINEGDRKILNEIYEQEMTDAIYGVLPSPSSIITPNLISLSVNLLQNSTSSYMNYKRIKSKLATNLKKDTWELDKDKLKFLNDLNKELLDKQHFLIKKYNLDDYWRTTRKDCSELIERLKDENDSRLFEYLSQSELKYQKFPVFWYYYGVYAIKNNKLDKALRAFNTYQEVFCQILRKDKIAASVAMNKISVLLKQNKFTTKLSKSLDKNSLRKSEIRNQLKIIEKNSDDFIYMYFCGLTYWNVLSDSENATRILQKVKNKLEFQADNKLVEYKDWWNSKEQTLIESKLPKTDSLMLTRIALLNIIKERKYTKDLIKEFDALCNKDTSSNIELLYFVGALHLDSIFENIRNEIRSTYISHESKWGRTDKFWVSLSLKWFLLEDIKPELELYSNGKIKGKITELAGDERIVSVDGMIKLCFRYEGDYIISNGIDCIKLDIQHKYCPVKIVFDTKEILEKKDNKWFLSYNKLLAQKAEFFNKTYNLLEITEDNDLQQALLYPPTQQRDRAYRYYLSKDYVRAYILCKVANITIPSLCDDLISELEKVMTEEQRYEADKYWSH